MPPARGGPAGAKADPSPVRLRIQTRTWRVAPTRGSHHARTLKGSRAHARFEVCKTKQGLVKRYGYGRKRGPGEQQGLTEQQTASYQGAFEAVLAVPIAAGFGYWFDRGFDSAPVGLLVGVGIGFFAMMLRIVRMRPEEPAGPIERATESSSTADRPDSNGPDSDRPESDDECDR